MELMQKFLHHVQRVSGTFSRNARCPLDQMQDCLTRFVELIGFINF
jgi:hypothetical protein